jgi:hypothetical protein
MPHIDTSEDVKDEDIRFTPITDPPYNVRYIIFSDIDDTLYTDVIMSKR